MNSELLSQQAAAFVQPRPEIRPGFTIRVHERVQESGKERLQMFEGLVISVHGGHVPTDTTITVRRIVSGVGVEKVFPLYAPTVAKIEVKKVAKVRRAKLFFLRGRRGKAARMSERFTMAEEFAQAAVETKSGEVEPAFAVASAGKSATVESDEKQEEQASSVLDGATEDTEKNETKKKKE